MSHTKKSFSEGYIVFVFQFVCLFVVSSVVLVEFRAKFYGKVAQVGYSQQSKAEKILLMAKLSTLWHPCS